MQPVCGAVRLFAESAFATSRTLLPTVVMKLQAPARLHSTENKISLVDHCHLHVGGQYIWYPQL